jgi:hypothetical protein
MCQENDGAEQRSKRDRQLKHRTPPPIRGGDGAIIEPRPS